MKLRPTHPKLPLLQVRNFLNVEKKQANILPEVTSIIDTLIKDNNDKSYKGGKGKCLFFVGSIPNHIKSF